MWRMLLPCGKLIGLFFVLSPPLSPFHILFLKPNVCTCKKKQGMSSLTLQWEPFSSCSILITGLKLIINIVLIYATEHMKKEHLGQK